LFEFSLKPNRKWIFSAGVFTRRDLEIKFSPFFGKWSTFIKVESSTLNFIKKNVQVLR
jgi:hypothetical protein